MSKLRVGIVGCGKIFPMHAYSLKDRDDVELVAISDLNEEKLDQWTTRLGVHGYFDYKQMMDTENLDVIHICTPHYLHKEMMIEALNRDIHVVGEKPATINYEDYLEVMEVYNKKDKALAISFQNRYNPASLEIKKVLEEKQIGKILSARARLTWNRSDEYYGQSDWKGTWEKEGGGVLIDQAIHTLDLLNWFLDRPVSDIEISMGRRGHSKIEVEDYVEGVIEYNNELIASIQFINHYAVDSPIEIEIVGEKGIIKLIGDVAHIDFLDGRNYSIGRDPLDQFNIDGIKQYWGVGHKHFIKDFYDTLIQGDKVKRNTLEDVESIHKLVFDIYEQGKKNFKVR